VESKKGERTGERAGREGRKGEKRMEE